MTQQYLLREIQPSPYQRHPLFESFIGKLRSKLQDDPTFPRYIETEAGVGYRFLHQPFGKEMPELSENYHPNSLRPMTFQGKITVYYRLLPERHLFVDRS